LPPPNPASVASRRVSSSDEIDALLSREAVCALATSGGKDSGAVATATVRYLDEIGHTGPRVLIHADLGRVEWRDSLPSCERLAAKLGLELIVVRRQDVDLLARWQRRWTSNLRRYAALECVTLILPWSTPSLRFCTSEYKTNKLASELKKRFPDREIVNVTGIRREESRNRAKMPVWALDKKLTRKGLMGMTWNPIIEWRLDEVLQEISDAGLDLHQAYVDYGLSRASCMYCVMSSLADLVAAAAAGESHDLYVQMVELEAESGFAFQGNRWLADIAPHLLSDDLLERVARAKQGAQVRVELEKLIPKHLHYNRKGWPDAMPTAAEAELLATVRRGVAATVGVDIEFTTGEQVLARYRELMNDQPVAANDDEGGCEALAA
jgi:3'-phosphoadenosine 5'-phosphosulfate sulfotransferase (PAPS reductase)/FAD synthetase